MLSEAKHLVSDQPNRKEGKGGALRQGRGVRDLHEQVGGERLCEARRLEDEGQARVGRSGGAVDAAVAVLRIREHVDLRSAAVLIVVMVVVRVVAVVVDGLAGNVPQHPDKVPAPVFTTGVDAEARVGKHVGQGQQQAAEESRCLFHWMQK